MPFVLTRERENVHSVADIIIIIIAGLKLLVLLLLLFAERPLSDLHRGGVV
jgi:hypothetical protein